MYVNVFCTSYNCITISLIYKSSIENELQIQRMAIKVTWLNTCSQVSKLIIG